MSLLACKPNADETLDRLRLFYSRGAGDQIFAAFTIPSPALKEFAATSPEGLCVYPDPDERIRFWDRYLREWAVLEDDSIPVAALSEFDQGLYGGVLGCEVRFNCNPETGWISSMVVPLLKDWSEFKDLRFDERHPWLQRYERQMDRFVRGARGRFGIGHVILINGLNFAFELVGATETYAAMIDDSETLREAMELGLTVNRSIQQRFFSHIPLLEGGTCSSGAQWIPGRVIAESVDPFHMTSVDYFEAWGRPVTERIMAEYDGGITHLHGNGRHLLEAVCTIKGLKGLILGDDKGYPAALDVADDLRARSGDTPLVMVTSHDRFVDKLNRHTLPGGVLYLVNGTPDAATANRCMETVRTYRC